MSARRVFFIGIGGSGMEPLAKFALRAGDVVSGSDSGIDAARFAKLSGQGARIFREHAAENLDTLFEAAPNSVATSVSKAALSDDQAIVVYSSAIAPEHVERTRARSLAEGGALRLMHRMDFLNDCFRLSPEALCVAGTHGKTSSSSMLGWVLLGLGLDPHIIVGGRPLYLPDGVRCGAGRTGVCETDESDGSFLKANPELRLVLNIDHDHLEHYGDFAALCAAFARFVGAGRLCLLNAADPQLREIGASHGRDQNSHRIYYYHALDPPTDQVESVASTEFAWDSDGYPPPDRSYVGRFAANSDSMQVTRPGESGAVGALQLKMPGRHFAGNALGVFALIDQAVSQKLLDCPDYDPRRALELLCEFPGVERRMEFLGRRSGAAVYDDYGHHPTEIEAVIAACRVRLGAGRLLAVFQPHRYTRTAALYREFAAALRGADRVYLLPLYTAGEAPIEGVDTALIARELGDANPDASPGARLFSGESPRGELLQSAFDAIFAEARPGDLVVCLGAGDISAGIRAYFARTGE
ncbi:MAG: cyanophycin synthetase [Leptospirales bacterium]|jgi:UDP-N-acetylmuramate--alanine ligase